MGKLKERIQKRANYAARFDLPYLDLEQIQELNRQAADLEGEALNAKRAEFVAEHCYLKLTVTRLADAEIGRAEELARKPYKLITKESSEQELNAAFSDYLAIRRDQVWPMLRRHVEKAWERSEEGVWANVPLPEANQELDATGLPERAWLVARYYDAVAEDRKKAEADPNFTARAS